MIIRKFSSRRLSLFTMQRYSFSRDGYAGRGCKRLSLPIQLFYINLECQNAIVCSHNDLNENRAWSKKWSYPNDFQHVVKTYLNPPPQGVCGAKKPALKISLFAKLQTLLQFQVLTGALNFYLPKL